MFYRGKNKFGALIEHGFAIYNVMVMDMTPLYMSFLVRLWRYRTEKEKKVNPTGSITARSIVPAP